MSSVAHPTTLAGLQAQRTAARILLRRTPDDVVPSPTVVRLAQQTDDELQKQARAGGKR